MTFLPRAPQSLRKMPEGVWALGFVSLFMDVSSEMISYVLREGRVVRRVHHPQGVLSDVVKQAGREGVRHCF